MIYRLFFSLLLSGFLCAKEQISLFKADITVRPDGVLEICEMLKVRAEGDQIRRGIIREFPTRYTDRWGNSVVVQFRITSVDRDGNPEPYYITDELNGKQLFIGDRDVMLTPDEYTYTICYQTNRQIGFFDTHDELYFNVTGNGWRLPIAKATAVIHLPTTIPAGSIQLEAFTGYRGARNQDAAYSIESDGTIVFATTKPLAVYQGLTIVVGWQKGYIDQPSWRQELYWFFDDNRSVFVALLGFILVLFYFIRLWRRVRRFEKSRPVIPLFYPPEGMTAGAVRYVATMDYDANAVASDVVSLAVDGYITIEQKKSFFGKDRYILHKKKEPDASHVRAPFFKKMFDAQDSVELGASDLASVVAAHTYEKKRCKNTYGAFFDFHSWQVVIGYALVLAAGMVTLFSQAYQLINPIAWMIIIGAIICAAIFTYLMRSYTEEGMVIKREIDGFKLFLEATEKDRFDIIGTPPTRTPELYEKYLPYAIALGVERAWSLQFAPIFNQMSKSGHPYVTVWYSGRSFDSFSSSSLSSTIGSSMRSAISSSGIKPGSSSGFGGRGSSGGGGGGGGGGGW